MQCMLAQLHTVFVFVVREKILMLGHTGEGEMFCEGAMRNAFLPGSPKAEISLCEIAERQHWNSNLKACSDYFFR